LFAGQAVRAIAAPSHVHELDAHLYWGEEVFAMLVVLLPVIVGAALLWYLAPRIGQRD
jgi:hypothetical protein